MSRICMCVVAPQNNVNIDLLRNKISCLFIENFLYVYYSLVYKEPCIIAQYDDPKKIVFSIADSEKFDNCEMFLLGDTSFYNGANNSVQFKERMRVMQKIIENILIDSYCVELFVGESGNEENEFEKYEISVVEFADISTDLLNVTIPPSVYFKITKD